MSVSKDVKSQRLLLQFFLLSEMSEVQQISLSQNILGQMSAQITSKDEKSQLMYFQAIYTE